MPGGSFVDTNIWVYAHLRTPDQARHQVALDFVSSLTDGVISSQVSAEYYNVMLRAKQSDSWIQENLSMMMGYVWFQELNSKTVRKSWDIRSGYGFSIWDSQIIAAALESGCSTLYTEDLQHGQVVEKMRIINPLAL